MPLHSDVTEEAKAAGHLSALLRFNLIGVRYNKWLAANWQELPGRHLADPSLEVIDITVSVLQLSSLSLITLVRYYYHQYMLL